MAVSFQPGEPTQLTSFEQLWEDEKGNKITTIARGPDPMLPLGFRSCRNPEASNGNPTLYKMAKPEKSLATRVRDGKKQQRLEDHKIAWHTAVLAAAALPLPTVDDSDESEEEEEDVEEKKVTTRRRGIVRGFFLGILWRLILVAGRIIRYILSWWPVFIVSVFNMYVIHCVCRGLGMQRY